MLQIRNVPDEIHRKLKSRAAHEGLTLSDYLLRLAEREVERPTIEELTSRLRRLPRLEPAEDSASIIRRMRDATG